MKKFVMSAFALIALAFPSFVSAQLGPQPDFNYTRSWVDQIVEWSKTAVTFLMVVATLFFIYVVIMYIKEKDAAKVKDRKNAVIRGVIGLFVIVAIWGIIRVISSTFGVGNVNTQAIPCPPGLSYNATLRICN